jgi:hypothetical protein
VAKDAWEKADIVGKLLSSVVLAIIAFVIKAGADNISAAQHQGDLVRSLITDLTTNDQHTRQDLALIALNHSVGDQNPALMIEIAERLVVDTTGYSAGTRASDQALSSIAFHILQQRDAARAESVKAQLQRSFEVQVSSDSLVRATLRSSPDTGLRPGSSFVRDSTVEVASSRLVPLASTVVFIQFRGSVERSLVEQLRDRFSQAGFAAPGVEHISSAFSSSIRYFHAEDAVLADSVARITQAFLQKSLPSVTSVPIQNLSRRSFRVPSGQIEIWISVP